MNYNEIIEKCIPYTMVGRDRLMANIVSVEKIVRDGVVGDVVEIGVCAGGSMMAMMYALSELRDYRRVFLYDTFDGMTEPEACDVSHAGDSANEMILVEPKMCFSSLESVVRNVGLVGYPNELITYVKGDILQNSEFPEKISILRLDTDWYKSTKYELENFGYLVTDGGVIMVDDYGHWDGARKAVDEYVLDRNFKIVPIDYTGVYLERI